ncbi:MAG: penicillin-binding protein 2 [Candidatus Paceibacterota bacterium]
MNIFELKKDNLRVNLIALFVLILFVFLGYRLVNLQIMNRGMWRALAQGQQTFFTESQGTRGEIYFQGKNKLVPAAVNEPTVFCFASPQKVKDKKKTAETLSGILDLEEKELLEKLSRRGQYAALQHDLSKKKADKIKSLDLDGIFLQQEHTRTYPQESLASQVLGFLPADKKGQYGLEEYYNKQLKGHRGFLKGEKGSGGNLIFNEQSTLRQGSDLTLTIDYNIQYFAQQLLKKAAEDLNIRGGSIIVMNPNTGEVMAMANYPNFDPNKYSEAEMKTYKNGAIQNLYEPGSVFKPLTMSAALNEDVVTPHTTYTDTGKVEVGGYTIKNYDEEVWGETTMTEVIERSINTGAVFVEQQLGHQKFLDYLEKFGIFEKTGIDLASETHSENNSLKNGYASTYATASYGQGVEVTAIQLMRAFSALINGGRLVKPHVVKNIDKEAINPPKQRRVISKETSSQITTMLVSAVENGLCSRAQVPGYFVGGKTGTALISWTSLGKKKKGYSDQTWESFMGFAPAFNPKFIALVKLDNPDTGVAGYSATPMFQKLAKYILNYKGIVPTKQ